MIKLDNLCAGYDGTEKLHGVSAEFKNGEVSVILGPNGCGKSTLLKAAAGIIPHTGGDILIDGISTSTLAPKQLAKQLAFLPQTRIVPSLTAEKLVLHGRFPYLSYPRRYSKADFEIVDEALDDMGIRALAKKGMQSLSGGERQKVYIAMALAQQTGCILMDEPTTYLDIDFQLALWNTARTLAARGKTVVIVTHDIPDAMRFADKLLILKDGAVHALGTPDEIYEKGALSDVFNVKIVKHGNFYSAE